MHCKKTFILLTILCFSCSALLFGCKSTEENKVQKTSDVINVVLPKTAENQKGFDPIYGWGCGEHKHDPIIQSTLLKTDDNFNIVNNMISDYKVSGNGLIYKFILKDNIKFSDGSDLTAADVAFTLNKMITTPECEVDLSYIEKVEEIDSKSVEITLKEPNNLFLYYLCSIGIVKQSTYDDNYGKNPIGSGKYVLEKWEIGKYATFSLNENYWGEKPKINKITVTFSDEDVSFASAKNNESDIAYTSAVFANNKLDNYEINAIKTNDTRGISLPTNCEKSTIKDESGTTYETGNAITGDLAIRYALNLATNREQIINNTLSGYGTSAVSVCDNLSWFNDKNNISYDKEKAIQVLEDAGWRTDSSTFRSKDGRLAQFDLYYESSDNVRQAMCASFAECAAEIGIKVNIIGESWEEIYKHQYSDAVLWGWGSTTPEEMMTLYLSNGSCNFPLYGNNVIDMHLNNAKKATNLDEMYKELKEAQYDENANTGITPQFASSWIWIANIDHLFFINKNLDIKNPKIQGHGHGWSLFDNVETWEWK